MIWWLVAWGWAIYIYIVGIRALCIGSTGGGQARQCICRPPSLRVIHLQRMAILVVCMRVAPAPCFTIALVPACLLLRLVAFVCGSRLLDRSADWLTTLGGRINVGHLTVTACWACCCLLLINRRERERDGWSICDMQALCSFECGQSQPAARLVSTPSRKLCVVLY